MSTAANPNDIYTGSGKPYFDRFDANGAPTGLRMLGNTSTLTVTPTVNQTTVTDYTKKTRTTVGIITQSQSHKVQLVLMETSPKNLALAMNGNVSAFTQTGGTITAEVLASTSLLGKPQPGTDMILQTAQRNISAVTLKVTTASTPVVLTSGTDYEIEDATAGLIRVLASAPNYPASGATGITADYTAAAVLATAGKSQVNGAAVPSITGKLFFSADPVSGRAQDLEAWRVTLTPSSAVNWISDAPTTITLDGEILDDSANHPATPFYRVIER